MPDQLNPLTQHISDERTLQGRGIRALSRSPHPYRRQREQLPHASLKPSSTFPLGSSPLRSAQSTDDETTDYLKEDRRTRSTESDSGTEADDEHFLKGLPAPKLRSHKGLRGVDGTVSGTPSPLLSPQNLKEGTGKRLGFQNRTTSFTQPEHQEDIRRSVEKFRRKRRGELWRRFVEVVLLGVVGGIVISSDGVNLVLRSKKWGLWAKFLTTGCLC